MCSYFPTVGRGFTFFYSRLPDNTVCEPYTLCMHTETLGSHPWTELHTRWGGPRLDTTMEESGG